MHPKKYYLINGITWYRLVVAPVLLFWAAMGWFPVFKWLLALSFFTDAIDGFLARHYNVVSKMGASIDSTADDLTVLAGIVAMVLYQPQFIVQQLPIFLFVFFLFLIQGSMAMARYGKTSAFHTYAAKLATLLQGIFLITFFFIGPQMPLFYAAALLTALQLMEEMILVLLLPIWQANVKGLYWILKSKHLQA